MGTHYVRVNSHEDNLKRFGSKNAPDRVPEVSTITIERGNDHSNIVRGQARVVRYRYWSQTAKSKEIYDQAQITIETSSISRGATENMVGNKIKSRTYNRDKKRS